MSLTIGELTGFLDLDTSGIRKGAAQGEAAAARMSARVLADLRRIEAEKAVARADADASALHREVQDARDALATLEAMDPSPEVDLQTAEARRKLTQLEHDLAAAALKTHEMRVRLDDSDLPRFTQNAARARKAADSLAAGLSRLGPAALGFSAAGLVPVLMGTAAALSSVNGAIGLLPAAAATAAVGVGGLKLATQGFGDALAEMDDPEKFAEALEKLSPAARSAAQSVKGLSPAWKEMQQSVQEAFFTGLGDKITEVGGKVTTILGGGFLNAARGANTAAAGILDMLAKAERTKDLSTIANSGGRAFGNLAEAMVPVTAALFDIGAVAGPIFEELTQGAAGATQRFADFIAQARETGKLEEWIRGGMAAFGDLMGILGNVGKLIGSVFRAANMDGAGLLETVRNLTAGWAQWAASAEGQERMGEIFGALNTILATTSEVMGTILPIIGDIVVWFSQLPGPVQTAVVGFVMWGTVLGRVLGLLSPLISVVGLIGPKLIAMGASIVGAVAKMGLLGTAARTAATATNASTLSIIAAWGRMAAAAVLNAIKTAGAWLLTTGANAATAVATMVATAARFVAQWALMAAQATVHALRVAGAWLLTAGANAATAVATMVATAARVVAQWVLMSVQAMARAAVMAAAWLVAMGPIGWIITAVVALVALVIANWDTVKQWTITAWTAIVDWLKQAWEWIKSAVSAAAMWVYTWVITRWEMLKSMTAAVWDGIVQWIKDAWNNIVSTVQSWIQRAIDYVRNGWENAKARTREAWDNLVAAVRSGIDNALRFVRELPGKILSALGNLGSLLLSAGRDLLNGLWNGIQGGWSWLTGKVRELASGLLNAAKSALGIASPSKKFRDMVGKWIPEGISVGIKANQGAALDAARGVAIATAKAASDATRTAMAQATRTVTAQTDAARAAGEVLNRMRSGGGMYEDLTWKGASSLVGSQNDHLLNLADARGVNTADRAALTRFLEQVQREGTSQRQVNVTVNNPLPESTSDSINRRARTLAKLGG